MSSPVSPVKITRDLRIIAPADAPPLTGSQALELGKRLLERGWGKPTQPLSGDKDAPPIGLSIEDQQREISERHERSRRLLDEVFNEIVTTQEAGSAGC